MPKEYRPAIPVTRLPLVWVLAIYLAVLLTQITYWQTIDFIDNDLWVYRINSLITDLADNNFQLQSHFGIYRRYSGHPGSSITLTGSLAQILGASSTYSLPLAVSFLNSLVITAIIVICRQIRPDTYWWLPAGILATLHPLYFYATPTNAVIAPLLTLITLLIAQIHFSHKPPNHIRQILLSLLIGVALSTRVSITIFVCVPLLASIDSIKNRKSLLKMLLIIALTAIALIPPLWFIPIAYAKAIILLPLTFLTTTDPFITRLTLWEFLQYAPFFVISIFLTISFLFKKAHHPSTSTVFLLVYLFITAAATTLFLSANFQSIRYFFPFVMFWDIWLALLLIDAGRHINFKFLAHRQQPSARRIFSTTAITILVIANFVLTYHHVYHPLARGVI